jgi:Na+/glutamate symporter
MGIPLGLAMAGVKGIAGIAGGIIGSGKRKRELKAAQQEYDRQKQKMNDRDTSNLYANQQNVYEDPIQ